MIEHEGGNLIAHELQWGWLTPACKLSPIVECAALMLLGVMGIMLKTSVINTLNTPY